MNDDEILNLQELKFVLLPGSGASSELLPQYNKVYECWKELWKQTLEEHDNYNALYSNDFTRQDEALALFYQGECIALCCLREVNFKENSAIDDAYFSKWPELTIHKLRSYGERVLICSQLTVGPLFRKNRFGVVWKDLIVALAARRLLETECEVMIGAVRRRKGMDKSTYRNGFIPLLKNMPYMGKESVDLVAYLKKTAAPCPMKEIANLVDILYPQTVVAQVA